MAKRAVESPPRATAESNYKKHCSRGSMPELSSLLSSLPPHLLLLAKRRCPSAAPHDRCGLKRPRYDDDDDLDAQMRGLEIRCDMDNDKEELRSTKEEKENGTQIHPSWSSFLPELLRLICRRLSLADVPRFRAVCKHWNSCAFPVYPADAAPVLISSTGTSTGLVCCYSPGFHKMFVLTTPLRDTESRIFSAAPNGWVVLTTPNKTVLFANLLDGSMSETPGHHNDDHGLFMCTPQDSEHVHPKDREIFGVYADTSTVRIHSWDGESWDSFEEHGGGVSDDDDNSDNDDHMEGVDHRRLFTMSSCCSPVLHKGLLYCLGRDGNVGVYDPMEIKWSVLRKPSSFGSEFPYKNCYLVESQGELLAVLTGKNGMPIYVLRLNETEMAWERMESLGGRSLFTGTTSSLSVSKPEDESMANKVYLPRFYGRPEVIQVELASSGGRLFFMAKPDEERAGSEEVDNTDGGAWFYDLESDSGKMDKQLAGSKMLLQYVWVHLGLASDDDGMET